MKLLIISHTAHYLDESGSVVGWGPTVMEINYLTKLFDEIIHVAPLHREPAPKSAIRYSDPIIYKPLKPSGGKFLKKGTILLKAPFNLRQVHKFSKDVDFIQFRAPTGMGIYILPYLRFLNRKPYWIKYAGNWVANKNPLGNRFQKWWLQKMIGLDTKVTINGIWPSEKATILSFENPCLTEEDRVKGKLIGSQKQLGKKYNYCFVGGLNKNKGIDKIIEVFRELNHKNIGTLHIVGDGALREQLELKAKDINTPVKFHGFLAKDKIISIYKECHFIILPSQSEGFPKVIGEAMNFGCVPIVSEVSCLNQYIQHHYNGFLINPLTVTGLKKVVMQSLELSNHDFKQYLEINYQLAEKFTYAYYLKRIQNEILK